MGVLFFFGQWQRPLQWRWLLIFVLTYRLFLCLTAQTAESPDEWWQSEEVAYAMVFGGDHLTWEWREAIRSYVFPLLYTPLLWLLKFSGTDTALTVWGSLRCTQAFILFLHDCSILALAQRLDALRDPHFTRNASGCTDAAHGTARDHPDTPRITIASTTLAMLLVSWFLINTGVRSYSNVAESLFFLQALLHTDFCAFLLCAGVGCAVRITAIFAVFPIYVLHVVRACQGTSVVHRIGHLIFITVGMVCAVMAAMCWIDYAFYGRFVFTPLNFLRFNILMNVSQYYGVHPFWWYALVLPVLTSPFSFFLVWLPTVWGSLKRQDAPTPAVQQKSSREDSFVNFSSRNVRQELKRWLFIAAVGLGMHSLVAHKEMRFVYFLIPLWLILSSVVVVTLSEKVAVASRPRWLAGTKKSPWVVPAPSPTLTRRCFTCGWIFSLILTFLLLYTYRRGGPALFSEIRSSPHHYRLLEVLTHCYATPGRAHVHGKVDWLRGVDCPMQINPLTAVREVTEDRLFRENPRAFVAWRYRRLVRNDGDMVKINNDEKLSEEAWWRAAQHLMPSEVQPVLPDALILFHNTALLLESDFLLPEGFRRSCVAFHALHSFEPDEDRYLELWTRTTPD